MNLESMKIFFLGNILGMLSLFSYQLSMGFFDDDLKKIGEYIKIGGKRMSKVSTKINRIKRKLDNISGLDDDFIMSSVNKVDLFVDIILSDVENYLKENKLNGTIFKNLK